MAQLVVPVIFCFELEKGVTVRPDTPAGDPLKLAGEAKKTCGRG